MKKIFIALIMVVLVVMAGCGAKTTESNQSGNVVNNPPQVLQPNAPIPIKVVSITSPVLPLDKMTVVVKTNPGLTCEISVACMGDSKPFMEGNSAEDPSVQYDWGVLTSPRVSNSDGIVTFTLMIGYDTLPGYYRVVISGTPTPDQLQAVSVSVLTSFLVQ